MFYRGEGIFFTKAEDGRVEVPANDREFDALPETPYKYCLLKRHIALNFENLEDMFPVIKKSLRPQLLEKFSSFSPEQRREIMRSLRIKNLLLAVREGEGIFLIQRRGVVINGEESPDWLHKAGAVFRAYIRGRWQVGRISHNHTRR